jgi:hypothetical protein
MPLSQSQAEQLYAAGTVPLPPHFPEVGRLTRSENNLTGPVVCIEHQTPLSQVKRYYVPIRDVLAVRIVRRRRRDPDVLMFGRDVREFLNLLPEKEATRRPIPLQQILQQQAPQQQAPEEKVPSEPPENAAQETGNQDAAPQEQTLNTPAERHTIPKQTEAEQQADQADEDRNTYGIVFVREDTGVLMQTDTAVAAGELESGARTCCRDDEAGRVVSIALEQPPGTCC